MSKIKVIITPEGKRYDMTKVFSEVADGELADYGDMNEVLVKEVYKLGAALGFKIGEPRWLGQLIQKDFDEIKPRTLQEITEYFGTAKNTTLGHLRKWYNKGLIYYKTKVGEENVYGVDYAKFAELTGMEIITY